MDPDSLAAVIKQYEDGVITRTAFADKVTAFATSPHADQLSGMVDGITLLRVRNKPYIVAADVFFGPAAVLVIEPGAVVVIGKDVTVEVQGRLYVPGNKTKPTIIGGASADRSYKTLLLSGGRVDLAGVTMQWATSLITAQKTATTPITIEESTLDNFSFSAIEMSGADKLVIRDNLIGMNTRPENAQCEALHGTQSAVVVQGNTFGRRTGYHDVFDLEPCTDGHFPVIVNNRFLGGDDDAVDLDDCHATVVGNYFTNFRPGPTAAGTMANGGGITGSGISQPLIANNVFDGLMHAIGFKNGARPTIINNTIINCDIGITLYSSGTGAPATGVAINNILFNNKTDIILNGSWFPAYDPNQTGSLAASFNILKDAALSGKDSNLSVDPLLALANGVPYLDPKSPARRNGQGDLAVLATDLFFPIDQLKAILARDFLSDPRPFSAGKFTAIDRGAVQKP